MIGCLPPPFGELWPTIFALLDKAVRTGGNDWEDVKEGLETRRAQLWLWVENGPQAAVVTKIDGDVLEIWLAGGRALKVLPYLETIIEASKGAGTKQGRIIGRRGWDKALKPYGWVRDGEMLTKRWSKEADPK